MTDREKNSWDVVIVNTTVHGGSYHKLIAFQQLLRKSGVKVELVISTSPHHGLEQGVDFD